MDSKKSEFLMNKSDEKISRIIYISNFLGCFSAIGQGMDKQYYERFEDIKRVDYHSY